MQLRGKVATVLELSTSMADLSGVTRFRVVLEIYFPKQIFFVQKECNDVLSRGYFYKQLRYRGRSIFRFHLHASDLSAVLPRIAFTSAAIPRFFFSRSIIPFHRAQRIFLSLPCSQGIYQGRKIIRCVPARSRTPRHDNYSPLSFAGTKESKRRKM